MDTTGAPVPGNQGQIAKSRISGTSRKDPAASMKEVILWLCEIVYLNSDKKTTDFCS